MSTILVIVWLAWFNSGTRIKYDRTCQRSIKIINIEKTFALYKYVQKKHFFLEFFLKESSWWTLFLSSKNCKFRKMMIFYLGWYLKFMLTVSRNHGYPIIFNIYTKSLNYVLNQDVDVTKRARFATFDTFILDYLCLLQQYKWNKMKIRLARLISNVPCRSNFMTILDFFICRWKKKTGRCREVILAVGDTVAVAVVERWTIVEVGLYQGRTLESLNLTKLAE